MAALPLLLHCTKRANTERLWQTQSFLPITNNKFAGILVSSRKTEVILSYFSMLRITNHTEKMCLLWDGSN